MSIQLPGRIPLVTIDVSQPLWRVHESRFGAVHFGRGANKRFDCPAGSFGVLYLGGSPGVAVLETLVRGADRCVVDERQWLLRSVSRVYLAEALRLMAFEGKFLPRFGVGAERAHAGAYGECQELSAALHGRHADVDGIQFRSRWDTSRLCWAVFERAQHKVRGVGSPRPLHGSRAGDQVLDEYEILLV